MKNSRVAVALASVALLFATPVPAQEPCPAGTEARPDGTCAPKIEIDCPAGTIFEQGRGCVAKVVECPAGMIVEANKCVAEPAPAPPPVAKPAEPPPAEAPPAAPGPPRRFFAGLRASYALAVMNVYRQPTPDASPVALADQVGGALPIGLEIGYRAIDWLYFGGLVSFGPAFARKASDGYCSPSASSCSGEHFRVAFQARVYPIRSATVDPWLGLGFGYERLTLRQEGTTGGGPTGGDQTTLSGIEYFNLSGGAEFKVLRDFSVGPFVSFSVGRYGTLKIRETAGDTTITTEDAIRNPSAHGWLALGVRGAFGLF